MFAESPLLFSHSLLAALGTRMFLHYENRIPSDSRVLVISNHRSFMDAPLLMAALGRPVRFACHHYMKQVPVLREVVTQLGAFPLEAPAQRHQQFFKQATELLRIGEWVGIFPEGAGPMVQHTPPDRLKEFQRGFAHLALRAQVENLAVLPVAIACSEEVVLPAIPVRVLSLFDPSEPMFKKEGFHPVVVYKRVNVLVGRPHWISSSDRLAYGGKQAKAVVENMLSSTSAEIAGLLRQGCY
ncbi:1-acyl-sn-glycerol-3-phosphate acyltransferase [Ancylothrix sp. C2]|uniref:lysophospholipid acyltransferase family protein n=1 Tax=Ancylothrix sp. D3o TaxID=2953691 RepID=UPI0021BA96CF|nr:lysophospholipid acyltransferase family protein [Ancylothrix sp. D3o]MCT7952096.1 1-acyl-sn-glycerol-3-phosphate acyltransferase [Ancylothrix sp. D3o]